MAEIVHVLESYFLALESADPALLLRALELYGSLRRDFSEMYLAAAAERLGLEHVVSFDRDLDAVASVTRIEP